jgi:hypothetical protein
VFDNTSLGIIVLKAVRDPNGKVKEYEVLMNNALGESWEGKKDQDLLKGYNAVMETGQPMKKELSYDGQGINRWFNVTAVRLNDNELVSTIENITELKKAEEEIKTQNKLLKQTEELAKAGCWEYDLHSKEFLWTDGMYQLFEIKKMFLSNPPFILTQ